MITLFMIALFVIIILFFFSSKASPIPYFPTNKQDIPRIIQAMKLTNNQIIIDLGAGDGAVIFAAAEQAYKKKLNTQFIAVDINIILVFLMQIRRLFHPHKANITILHADIFLLNYKKLIGKQKVLFYIYISPWYITRIFAKIQKLNTSCGLISYFYSVKEKKARVHIKGAHDIYVYQLT